MGETPMPRNNMDAYKINVKFFAREPRQVAPHEFVPIFHSWIQIQDVPEHTLIDVADYAHVQDGPGILLVAHEANFYADSVGGRLGFTYQRKHPFEGSFSDRLRQAIIAALEGCQRLELDPRLSGKIAFRTDEVVVQLNDRLLAPNTAETFEQVRPELDKVFSEMYGAPIRLEHRPSARELFEVRAKPERSAATVTDLLNRLSATATAPSR